MKSSIPVNCLWGSARSCHVAPVHFEPPRTCCPSSPRQAPSEGSSVQWSSSPILVNRRGAQHAPVVRPPFTFGCILWLGFEFSPRARAGPRAAAVGDEGFGLPACSARCHTPPRSSPHGPWPPLFAHVQINVPGLPHVPMLRTHSVGLKSLQAAEWPADLAPVRFNCWQSTGKTEDHMVKERDRERTQRVTKEVTRRGQKEGRIGGGT